MKLTPKDHPDRAMYLNNLGIALGVRFELIGSMDDFDRGIETKEEAFKTDTAPPSLRLEAATSCSNLLIGQRMYDRAKPMLEEAVHLLPIVSPVNYIALTNNSIFHGFQTLHLGLSPSV